MVLLEWTATLGSQEISNFTCVNHEALNRDRGPDMLVRALYKSIHRELTAHPFAEASYASHRLSARIENIKVQVSATYHCPQYRLRRRGQRRYPREQKRMHQGWTFTIGHPASLDFLQGFRELYAAIHRQGWPVRDDRAATSIPNTRLAEHVQLVFAWGVRRFDSKEGGRTYAQTD